MSLRHSHIRNITASSFTEVCNNVRDEPPLQQLTRGMLQVQKANENEVRLDICARGFCKTGQRVFFDGRFLTQTLLDILS